MNRKSNNSVVQSKRLLRQKTCGLFASPAAPQATLSAGADRTIGALSVSHLRLAIDCSLGRFRLSTR